MSQLKIDDFVMLSELGLSVEQIRTHFQTNEDELESLVRTELGVSAGEANKRLSEAGPVSLLTEAAKWAKKGDTKLMLYLLEKLWHPQVQAGQGQQYGHVDVKGLSNDQLTRIYRIMSEGGI